MNTFRIHIDALFRKRLYIYRRNYKGLIVEVLIPVVLVLIGFAFSKVRYFFNPPERLLTPNDYPLMQRILMNEYTVHNDSNSTNLSPSVFAKNLPDYSSAFTVTYEDFSSVNITTYGEK